MAEQKMRPPTPEEVLAWREQEKIFRMEFFLPQISEEGKVRLCEQCRAPLHPLENGNYDGTTGGFCNKLCRRAYEKDLMYVDNFSAEEAGHEIDKFESYKPIRVLV